jgi:hypothetical protein
MAGAVTTESYSELQARYEDLLRGEVRATDSQIQCIRTHNANRQIN